MASIESSELPAAVVENTQGSLQDRSRVVQ